MPRLSQQVVATTEHRVELTTSQRTLLVNAIKESAKLNAAEKDIKLRKKANGKPALELLYELGEEKVEVEGVGSASVVAPEKPYTDLEALPKILLRMGVPLAKTMKALAEATTTKPTEPYVLLTPVKVKGAK